MPEQSSMAAYVECMQPKLSAASPSELAIALKALARLHFLPTRAWLNDWVAAARRQVRGFQAEETANALACFATWKVKPPRDFTQDLFELTVAQARQGAFPPYFAARMLCALATLRLAPPRQVLRQLLQVLGSESLVVQNEQVGVKHSGKVGSVEGPEAAADPRVGGSSDLDHRLMAAALANAFAALPCLLRCYDPQQLASLAASAAGSVAVVQGDDIMDGSDKGSAGDPGGGALSSAAASAVAAGAVHGDGESSNAPAESNIGDSTAANTGGMSSSTNSTSSSDESKNLAGATTMLLPPSVVGPMLGVLSRRLHLLQGHHLCSVLLALVRLKLYPGRGFLMSHVSAVAGQLPHMASNEKRRLSAYYAELSGQ
ncbi:hypothetical protein DUNSADRAFT_14917 [Dunaliella salina]|nr:hypothetical protein DUNSADRAFT_14917 [Dunaliella salina]|eukprot:KAF5830186.1 hypothetical protein DUNSADRAFT_14917 [Dunaliella salina]